MDPGKVEGVVFNIQRYSTQDGPGIRTVVFLKGCPLRCAWCSNPESQEARPQLLYFRSNCRLCRRCVTVCPAQALTGEADGIVLDRERCRACGRCASQCVSGGLRFTGYYTTVEEVMAEVAQDLAFYRESGGGLTLSGGEPTRQPEFACELLKWAHRRLGVDTVIETCGLQETEAFLAVLEHTDLVYFDLKHMRDDMHRRFTGAGNALILHNAQVALGSGKKVVFHLPIIPGWNDDEANILATARFIRENGGSELELLPYHALGAAKHRALGRTYELEAVKPPSAERMRELADLAAGAGINVSVGG